MEILASILNWFFIHTIYGLAAIAGVIYLALKALRKVIPKLPQPEYIVIPLALIGLFTLPSLPRYQFERDVMAKIEGKDWIRVVNQVRVGTFYEPLTWFKPAIGSITIIMPNHPLEGGFREATMRYGEEEILSWVEPDCTDQTIWYSRPGNEGVVHYVPVRMSDEQTQRYCEYDWSKEKEALWREMLRQRSSKTPG